MGYKAKSAIIGRMGKRDEAGSGPVFVHLFSINDPHKTDKVPDQFIEFEKIHKINIVGLDISYLIAGSDILINDLKSLSVEQQKGEMGHLIITGEQ